MTNRKHLSLKNRLPLPAPPDGWFDVAYSISLDGTLSCLRANSDIVAALARRRELQSQTQGSVPDALSSELNEPLFRPDTLARIHRVGDAPEVHSGNFLLEYPFPLFDRLSGGRWIVANARCEYGAKNARVLDRHGGVRARLCLGDGIEHLQCDRTGKIWVGYFDEGIFGGFGWGLPNVAPLGCSGLVLFDDEGKIDWTYTPPTPDGPWIADCYALNVGPEGAWCCIYTDFPILHVGADTPPRVWSNEITFANAIAVQDGHVALLGGYEDDATRLALVRLENTKAEMVAAFDLDIGDIRHARLVAGRGDTLHIVAGREWYKISVRNYWPWSGSDVSPILRPKKTPN